MDPIVTPAEVSPTLDDVAKEFSMWRETRKHRGRIPNRLWDAAIALTTSYPARKVAEALHLNYTEMKKRMVPTPPASDQSFFSSSERLQGIEGFVEVGLSPLSSRSSGSSCQLEVETVRGSRFRCIVHGPVPDNLLRFVQTLL